MPTVETNIAKLKQYTVNAPVFSVHRVNHIIDLYRLRKIQNIKTALNIVKLLVSTDSKIINLNTAIKKYNELISKITNLDKLNIKHTNQNEVTDKAVYLPGTILQNILSYSLNSDNNDIIPFLLRRQDNEPTPFVFRHYNKTKTCTQVSITYGGLTHIPLYREMGTFINEIACLLYTSPSPRDGLLSRMPSSA